MRRRKYIKRLEALLAAAQYAEHLSKCEHKNALDHNEQLVQEIEHAKTFVSNLTIEVRNQRKTIADLNETVRTATWPKETPSC